MFTCYQVLSIKCLTLASAELFLEAGFSPPPPVGESVRAALPFVSDWPGPRPLKDSYL